jgi:hypothetical protein
MGTLIGVSLPLLFISKRHITASPEMNESASEKQPKS